MNDEIRSVRHGIDLVDCRLQSSRDVRICRLVRTDVAVADLHKTEVPAFAGTSIGGLGVCPRHRNATAQSPYTACARPWHALKSPPTIKGRLVHVFLLT